MTMYCQSYQNDAAKKHRFVANQPSDSYDATRPHSLAKCGHYLLVRTHKVVGAGAPAECAVHPCHTVNECSMSCGEDAFNARYGASPTEPAVIPHRRCADGVVGEQVGHLGQTTLTVVGMQLFADVIGCGKNITCTFRSGRFALRKRSWISELLLSQ